MGLLPNTITNTNTSHDNSNNNNMGFLLVFFPKQNTNKTNFFSSSLKRTNSNPLLSKTQSTISICIFLLFATLLFFTLSTFETTNNLNNTMNNVSKSASHFTSSTTTSALQRMGTLYRRGTKSMNDIIICHVIEDTTENDFRLFLRLLHRSSITSKSDVVFIFPSSSFSSRFHSIIREESESFLLLVQLHRELNSTRWSKDLDSGFDVTRFFRNVKVQKKVETSEPLWGKKIRNNSSGENEDDGELTRMSYGSVLSFDANELDPENSLAGFMDRVPLSLRRWACYTMLLGRVRRNFKHVMLIDVKNLLLINDPLGRVRNRSPESVFLFTSNLFGKHGKRTQSQTQNLVNSEIIMGGARGVRRFSNAMLVEIVRVTMQHKKRNSVSESAILSQLVRNEFILRNIVDLITSSELIQEASSLAGRNSVGSWSFSDYLIIQRGNGNYDLNSIVNKKICSSLVDSSVYRDCFSH